MDCSEVRHQTDLFIDDALSAAQMQEFEQHISSCADCKKYIDDALRLKTALSLMGDKQPPKGLAQSAIRKTQKRPIYAYLPAASAMAAAAVILVVALSTGLIGGGSLSASPEESIMFSLEIAEDMAAPMAEYDDGYAGITDEYTVATDNERENAGFAKVSEPVIYQSEAEFAADYAKAYYKPALLPEGAALETIALSENKLVFTYGLGEDDAFVFEWLLNVPAGGLETELSALYGNTQQFTQDGGYYVLEDTEFLQVYFEQDGQAFTVRLPEGMDYKTYSAAIQTSPQS